MLLIFLRSIHKQPGSLVLIISVVLMLFSMWYTLENRYYFRFVPLPLNAADTVNNGGWLLPSSQAANPMGSLEFGNNNLRTEAGLRNMLNSIQQLSPVEGAGGTPSYIDSTFDKRVNEITTKPFFCADATQLLILAAWKQGLPTREWYLLGPGWPPGQGYSVAEYFNLNTGKRQLVDTQHAAIISGPGGKIIDMVTLLKAYRNNRESDIWIDYGPHREVMLKGVRGGTIESIFFNERLLDTPVLQLRQATWFALVSRSFGFSGHLLIAYPIVLDGWSHDHQVLTSKVTVLLTIGFGIIAVFSGIAVFRQIHRVARSIVA